MSTKNHVKLRIFGNDFTVTSDDSEEYIRSIGANVEERMKKLLDESESMSVLMASVFSAMEFCDESSKANAAADNLRAQINEYLRDAAKARSETEEARKRIASLQGELQALKARTLQREHHS